MAPTDARAPWLCYLLSGASPLRIPGMLSRFGSIEAAFAAGSGAFVAAGVKPEAARRLADPDRLAWRAELDEAEKADIRVVPFDDAAYPECLRRLSAPPPVLFVRGALPGDGRPALAVVGTRHPSVYGIRMAGRFAGELARFGFVVVSGLARGIDTRAHEAALAAGGTTIAVIGSGLLDIYPAENAGLADRIAASGGAVVSEFPLRAGPRPENFPRRNRVISGLASGVLVVEAGRRSGALITADYALEQDREVFALPGPADSLRSAGTHFLIKEGARLVESPDEIVAEFEGRLFPPRNSRPRQDAVPLSPDEQAVLDALDETRHIEDLLEATSLPASTLCRILAVLETRGAVTALPGRFYRAAS